VRRLVDALGVGVREWRTVAVLLWANWLVAGLMVAPSIPRLVRAFGHAPRAVGRPLLSFEQLFGLGPVLVHGGTPSLGAPLLLLVVLQTFLVGGVVWRACASGPFRLGAFMGQSGRLVGRNARLYLWLLLLLLVAALVPVLLAIPMRALGLHTVFATSADRWVFGRPFTLASVLHLCLVALAVGLWRLSLEVGRVLLFRDDLHATRRAAWRAVRLVLRAPGAVALYTVLGALATLAVLLLARVHAVVPEGSVGLALLALGVAQGVIWVRLAFQVAGTRFAAALVESTGVGPPRAGQPVEPVAPAPSA
jgi:hypothetical protein